MFAIRNNRKFRVQLTEWYREQAVRDPNVTMPGHVRVSGYVGDLALFCTCLFIMVKFFQIRDWSDYPLWGRSLLRVGCVLSAGLIAHGPRFKGSDSQA